MKLNKLFLLAAFLLPTTFFAQSMEGDWTVTMPGQAEGTTVTAILHLEGGTYTVDFSDSEGINVEGKYTMDGDQMTIMDVGGNYACPEKKGVYAITVTETELVMARVSDECEGRGGPEGMRFSRM